MGEQNVQSFFLPNISQFYWIQIEMRGEQNIWQDLLAESNLMVRLFQLFMHYTEID